mgnify:CR=1 FL=1
MALRFRLRGLAETFIEEIQCPCCGCDGIDDQNFSTEHTKVTYEGIIIVLQCNECGEIFVPNNQKLGIIDQGELKSAVTKDHLKTGEPIYQSMHSVLIDAEKLNACRKGLVH